LRVRQELGHKPEVYYDVQLESGVSWPPQLGHELGRSRILLALWAGDYFASEWCREEMAQMLAREEACGLRTNQNPRGLVVPAVIHDGEKFPKYLAEIHRFEIQECFSVRMPRDSPTAERLDRALRSEAPALAHAIDAAPAWRNEWATESAKRFRARLRTPRPRQSRPSSFTD
jgi:hypothetical protein